MSKYNSLAASSCIKLPKELDHLRNGIIIQETDDNECFKWCLVWHLNHAYSYPGRITKAGKNFAKNLNFKDIKFPVKVRDG